MPSSPNPYFYHIYCDFLQRRLKIDAVSFSSKHKHLRIAVATVCIHIVAPLRYRAVDSILLHRIFRSIDDAFAVSLGRKHGNDICEYFSF